MKILYVLNGELESGVIPSQFLRPARQAAITGNEIHLFAGISLCAYLRPSANLKQRMELCRSVFKSCRFFPIFPSPIDTCTAAVALKHFIRKLKPDVIHARGVQAANISLYARGHTSSPKLLFDCRGVWGEEFRISGGYRTPPLTGKELESAVARCRKKEAFVVQRADGMLAVTPQLVEYYANQHRTNLTSATIIPCCADTSKFQFDESLRSIVRTELGISNEVLWIYSGSSAIWQAPEKTIRLLSGLLKAKDNQRLLILTQNVPEFTRLCTKMNFEPGKIIIRSASPKDVPGYLCAADAGVLLREQDIVNRVASPVKFAEYLCAGLPVLISDGIGTSSGMVRENNWGVITPDFNSALESGIKLLGKLPLDLAERRDISRKAAELLGWDKYFAQLICAYQKLDKPGPEWVAHVNHTFPSTRQTFTYREIKALVEEGIDIRPFSLRPPQKPVSAEAQPFLDTTRYLAHALSLTSLAANCRMLYKYPEKYFSWLRRCLFTPYNHFRGIDEFAQSIFQFLRAAPLAEAIAVERGTAHIHVQFTDGAATTALIAADYLDAGYSLFSHTSFNIQFLTEKLRRARFVASISESDKATLLKYAPDCAEKISLVHCGVPLEQWPMREKISRDNHKIISVGGLIEVKGHLHLIRACSELKQQGIKVDCTIVGEGPRRARLEPERALLGLKNVVHLPGALPQEEVRPLINEAEVFVLACVKAANGDTDGIPVVLMEAMAAGVPVISTAISGIPELIEDGKTGLLVPPGDEVALADAIQWIFSHPDEAYEMALAARRKIEEAFTLSQQGKALASLLRKEISR